MKNPNKKAKDCGLSSPLFVKGEIMADANNKL